MRKLATLSLAIFALAATSSGLAAKDAPKVSIPDSFIESIRGWAENPVLIEAIKAQNAKNANLSQEDIDKQDKQWRAETKASAKPMIDAVLGNDASAYLKKVKADSKGLFTEIFAMDNKGLNVGQSDATSDYWQGDEAKWQKSYGAGPNGYLVDEVEFDESTQTYQSQVSVAIVDPATKDVIGAVTVGVNVEMLD